MPARRHATLLVLVVVLLAVPTSGSAEATPHIVRIEPNPITHGNAGEYVVIAVPEPTDLDGWRLTDGRYNATLPDETVEGRIAVSGAPRTTELLTETPVRGWNGYLPLSAEGERIALVTPNGTVVDRVSFGPVDETASLVRGANDRLAVREHGPRLSPFPNRTPTAATAFVLPDAPEVVIETLLRAERRLWLAGYAFTDPTIADILIARSAAGVDVRVLLDGSPVGGQAPTERALLDRLSKAGIPVTVLEAPRRRYAFHHPKYAVVDETALIMSENWKAAGVGGNSSRGWGVAIRGHAIADDLATVFATDAGWRGGVHWDAHAENGARLEPNRSIPLPVDRHDPANVAVDRARLVTAPEHAESVVRRIIAGAEERIEIQQVRIGDVGFPLLEATRRAAERGVTVRIHLDDTWYVAEENAALIERLAALRAEHDVEVSMANHPGRFGKVHNKGLVVDEEIVVLGSMNWNNASMRENREVMVVLRGSEVGRYYSRVLAQDHADPRTRTPVGYLGVAVSICGAAALMGVRWVTFDP